ncbi:AglZ/HisF2 family acetamidino modification protein [Bradyrhizobium sp. NP1]|uniref:AglZ/HisF2 family acetamidino modification protein n=1 Tax=Bradyrhizobium sp. NP1 TaxID=3049772 RepID=UPI0025A63DAD|nr:AglZ/HisF2 family acetamidino modification protein [Bradyrhizobium sp. NP1]WJR76366.1 AglZ/HisF2 family acetamidino modification protein [Bradyrhizobium sp. NP1]
MRRTRVIPTLLLRGAGLVKTTGFRNPVYVGDPINAIRIFNEKEVDELVLLDITASRTGKGPAFATIENIASECFMPVAYGGGIGSVEHIRKILGTGIEKVVINSAALRNPELVREAAREFGSQAIAVSIDVKRRLFGRYEVYGDGGSKATGHDPVAYARTMQDLGAGEILLASIDRDGTMTGYDVDLVSRVTAAVGIPVIASGGAGKVADFTAARRAGAAAVAAGAMFVFHGPHRAVLITYPSQAELSAALN